MKNKFLMILIISLCLSSNVLAQIATGGAFTLEKSVVATGGGDSTSGAFSLTGTNGQNAAGTNISNPSFSQIGGFWTPDQFQPTAAMVSISGKIMTANGRGIRNVVVRLTDLNGSMRTVVTGSFGYYRFTDVEIGQNYILTVASKRYIFVNSTQIISVNEEMKELNFIANER